MYRLQKGQILVSGKQNGYTHSARLSVRGANYVLATAYDSAAEVSVLEGEVEAQPRAMEEVGDAPEPFLVSADEQALLYPKACCMNRESC